MVEGPSKGPARGGERRQYMNITLLYCDVNSLHNSKYTPGRADTNTVRTSVLLSAKYTNLKAHSANNVLRRTSRYAQLASEIMNSC